MKKIISSLIVVIAVSALTISTTRAYFSDTETSSGNRITAGTLDLDLSGKNEANALFPDTGILPDETASGTWTVRNAGSVTGYLDLHNISKSSDENGCTEPESSAGDATCTDPEAGELLNLLNIHLFVDTDNDGVYDDGTDATIFNGLANDLAANYDQNLSLAADETKYITMVVNWPSSQNDIKAQSDTFNFDMTFELGQTETQ